MLLLDSLLCVLTAIVLIASLTKYLRMRFWILAGAGLLLLAHLYFESFRWQMTPVYTVLLLTSLLMQRQISSKPMVIAGSFFILASVGLSFALPVFDLPHPDGPFPVGVTDRHLVDSSRAEVQTDNDTDRREIGLRIWYPAVENSISHRNYWVRSGDRDSALVRGLRLPASLGFLFSHIALVETNSSADVALAAGSFPVLVFSHGLNFGTSEQNTVLMEHLASHGYVIFSIDHPYWGLYYRMPDGRVALSDKVQENFRLLFEHERTDELDNLQLHIEQSLEQLTAQLQRAAEILVKSTAANQVGIDIWSADQRFVLDMLPIFQKEDSLLRGKLNVDQVGIFGMSFGGTTSVQTCIVDSRCVAGANIDGFQLNLLNLPAMQVPFLILGEQKFEWHRITFERSEGDAYLVRIADTEHANFTDFAMLSPFLVGTPVLGSIDPTHGLELLNVYVKAFFDTYLLQVDGTPSIEILTNDRELVTLDSKKRIR